MQASPDAPYTLAPSPAAPQPLRLGFAAKVVGREGLKSNDTRRWQSNPHLSVSIGYLHDILDYLAQIKVNMYRMSSDIAPYVTHPEMPQFHGQITECAADLHALGEKAKSLDIRLSMHPSQFIVLNSPDPGLVKKSVADLLAGAQILDCMGLGPEAVLVVHVGGAYGDRVSGAARWVETFATLPEPVRRRLVLENDDIRYSAADVLSVHERTGVPLIFDYQHFCCFNPERLPVMPTVARFIGSWPAGVRPKIHYSSPDTNMREIERRNRQTGKLEKKPVEPIWTGHADFINPFEFATFMREVREAGDFDIMLEAKYKDVALLRLRRDLPRYAPDLAPRFGLVPLATGDAPPEGAGETEADADGEG